MRGAAGEGGGRGRTRGGVNGGLEMCEGWCEIRRTLNHTHIYSRALTEAPSAPGPTRGPAPCKTLWSKSEVLMRPKFMKIFSKTDDGKGFLASLFHTVYLFWLCWDHV